MTSQLELGISEATALERSADCPIARISDPTSSHEAARAITESGERRRQSEQVLAAVRDFPGKTSLELSTKVRLDRYAVARRLPELEAVGLIQRGRIRPCAIASGVRRKVNALTWWPA